jgi:hypothetical protein
VVDYSWRGSFTNAELNDLHAEGFGHRLLDVDWQGQVSRHSLDFEDHLRPFYFGSCGFSPTSSGLQRLRP